MEPTHKKEGFASQKLIVLPDAFLQEASAHPLCSPLYVTDIGYFPRALYHYRERPEGASSHILLYCVSGSGWYSANDQRRVSVAAHTIVILPCGMPHQYGASEEEPWSLYWLHFRGELAGFYFSEAPSLQAPVQLGFRQSIRFTELFDECYDALEQGYTLSRMVYVSQVLHHLFGLLRLSLPGVPSERESNGPGQVEHALRLMQERIEHADLSLDLLCEAVNLSKPHFMALFKQATGYSPIQYYHRLKIQRACQYLDLTKLSVKQISHFLGLADPYYFSRMFKRFMGLSPQEYRKRLKG